MNLECVLHNFLAYNKLIQMQFLVNSSIFKYFLKNFMYECMHVFILHCSRCTGMNFES